jgi:hypothetical protein
VVEVVEVYVHPVNEFANRVFVAVMALEPCFDPDIAHEMLPLLERTRVWHSAIDRLRSFVAEDSAGRATVWLKQANTVADANLEWAVEMERHLLVLPPPSHGPGTRPPLPSPPLEKKHTTAAAATSARARFLRQSTELWSSLSKATAALMSEDLQAALADVTVWPRSRAQALRLLGEATVRLVSFRAALQTAIVAAHQRRGQEARGSCENRLADWLTESEIAASEEILRTRKFVSSSSAPAS